MRAYGDIGGIVRERIAQFLDYHPRNKLVFTPTAVPGLKSLDMGHGLASLIKDEVDSSHLPMIAEESFNALMKRARQEDELIGTYVAITNWGILLEPDLKLNLLYLFDSFSKDCTLILVNCGMVECQRFYLADIRYNKTFPIGNLQPYVIL